MYVFICGGHHDSDRMAVLVMVSKAESIVVYFILYMHTCLPFRILRNYYGKAHQITVLRRGVKLLRTFWITEI